MFIFDGKRVFNVSYSLNDNFKVFFTKRYIFLLVGKRFNENCNTFFYLGYNTVAEFVPGEQPTMSTVLLVVVVSKIQFESKLLCSGCSITAYSK